jgi:hypothetical protein
MKTIIVGRYGQQGEAERASRELLRAGFAVDEMSLFYVNPEGQHAIYPVGGDEDESPGTHDAKSGAMRGAAGGVGAGALVGVATIPVLGPAAPLLGAAVGAYTGSLVGALSNMEGAEPKTDPVCEGSATPGDVQTLKAGVVLAVAVETSEEREYAIEILGERAQEVEETEGSLQNGDWIDFDPLAPCKVIR